MAILYTAVQPEKVEDFEEMGWEVVAKRGEWVQMKKDDGKDDGKEDKYEHKYEHKYSQTLDNF